jgi:transglutaminase-like putative cysteine protease
MRRTSVHLGCIIPVVLLVGSSVATEFPSDAQVRDIISSAPGTEEFPEASLLYLKLLERVTLSTDGQTVKEGLALIKILQDRARDRESDRKIPFDGEKQRVVLVATRTHLPDGSVREPEPDGIMEVSEMEAARAPFYSNARLKVVSFPGVEPGAVIELRYRIEPIETDEEDGDDEEPSYFQGEVLFQKTEPVLDTAYEIVVPQDSALFYTMVNDTTHPDIQVADGLRTYTWRFQGLEQILRDRDSVPVSMVSPRLLYSSKDEWDVVADWFRSVYLDHVEVTEGVQDLVRSLTSGARTPDEGVKALVLYVLQDVRNVPLELGKVGFSPSEVDRIIANKYGDVRDKTLLLLCLLQATGVEAEVAFFNSMYDPFVDFPAIKQFDALAVRARRGDGTWMWLNADSEDTEYGTLPYEMSRRRAFVVGEDDYALTHAPNQGAEANSSRLSLNIVVDESGNATGELVGEFNGMADTYYRSFTKHQREQQTKNTLIEWANQIKKGAKLIDYEVSDPVDLTSDSRVRMSFSCDDFTFVQGDVMLLELPGIPVWYVYPGTWHPSNDKIHVPALSRNEATVEYTYSIAWSGPMEVGYLPEAMEISAGPVAKRLQSERSRNSLTITKLHTYHRGVVEVEEYPEVFDMLKEFGDPKNSLIIWELGG